MMINPMALLQQMMQNPVQTLLQARLNIPQGMNDPNAIMQHLLNTGQVSQEQMNRAKQMSDSPMIRQMFMPKM